jgi:peptidyl-prolyl cis-trans isomerase SurA
VPKTIFEDIMKKIKIIPAFCVCLFLALFAFAQPQKVVADKIVSIVGDRIILSSEIDNTIKDLERQQEGQMPPNAKCMIMEQAMVSKVLMLQAEKDSLPVTDEEVEADLDLRVREFIRMYGTQQALEEVAGKTIYQIKDDARASVKERKLAEAMQRKIVENVKITPTEVKAFFDRIPKDSLPFYETELEIGQIVVYPKASKDLEKYIIDELNNYKKQVETKVTTFDQLAKRYSEDPGSKDRGGQYQINRTEKVMDPAFVSAAFRLKEGEISNPVKTKFGFHIIQMVQRNGDDAVVRHILRIPPVTDEEMSQAFNKLDTVRSKIIAGTLGFAEAANKYTEDDNAKFLGPLIVSHDGDTYNTIDELDKELVTMLDKLKLGEYSQPTQFTDDKGKKGVRIVYLKSKSEPHRMNMKDDYNKIAQMALEEKKQMALEKWLHTKIPTYYIMIDNEAVQDCPQLQKWTAEQKKAF